MLHHQVLNAHSAVQTRTVVAVDIRKAYDSVPHKAVIESADVAGVRRHMLTLIKNLLYNRTYRVQVGEYIGPSCSNRIGVPQGAVLSPILFNLVMARLPPLLEEIP